MASAEDSSTYVLKSGGNLAFLWIHVDDGLLIANSEDFMVKLRGLISEKMRVKWYEEATSLVGVQVRSTPMGFRLLQPALIRKLLKEDGSGMTVATPLADTSLESNEAGTPDTLSRIGFVVHCPGSAPRYICCDTLLGVFFFES